MIISFLGFFMDFIMLLKFFQISFFIFNVLKPENLIGKNFKIFLFTMSIVLLPSILYKPTYSFSKWYGRGHLDDDYVKWAIFMTSNFVN